MAEGTGLENRHTGNGIESSNLSLSARTDKGLKKDGRADSAAAIFAFTVRKFSEIGRAAVKATGVRTGDPIPFAPLFVFDAVA